ncbi:hypothetical protein [Streptomyces sp. NPDC006285]|uniref:hypothetical protein n=1 Tax=Streptomyces sp. NPDC006285 TaxID=3364742 RepID=UPI00369F70A9
MTVDAEGRPTALGRADDVGVSLPPAVLLPAPMTMLEVCTGSALDLLALNPYGALVHDVRRTLGVLERRTISAYLITLSARGTLRSDTPSPQDAVLAGVCTTPVARVICRCGRLNTLTAYDPEFPPACPGPRPETTSHPLVIRAE